MSYTIENKREDGTLKVRMRFRALSGKWLEVKQAELPRFMTVSQVVDYHMVMEARYSARKKLEDNRDDWRNKYYKFNDLVDIYEKYVKISAPNSYKHKMVWFRDYVLPYFLNERKNPNLDSWKYDFLGFKDYLLTVKSYRGQKLLSKSSRNHCITELNSFLARMALENKCDYQPRLNSFPRISEEEDLSLSDIVSDEEYSKILESIDGDVNKTLYKLLRHTGMRSNEAFGISLADFKMGKPPSEKLVRLIEDTDKEILCYIVLTSQPLKTKRDNDLSISRKPLKMRSTISIKNGRYLPITCNILLAELKVLIKKQVTNLDNRLYTKDPADYCLFFDDTNKNIFRNVLVSAHIKAKLNYKSPHKLRHSCATELAGEKNGYELCQLILGHNSRTTDRYIHLKEKIIKDAYNQATSFRDFI